MASIVKTLRAAADPNRLRILLLLKQEELSVAELQEILSMGQSTISTHLAQLKQAGLVEDRRTGKSSLYRLSPDIATNPDAKGHYAIAATEGSSALKGHNFSDTKDDSAALKGHDFSDTKDDSAALKGHNFSDTKDDSAALKGHDFSRAGTGISPDASAGMKGTGFSPYISSLEKEGALAPEGSSFLNSLLSRAQIDIPEAPSDRAAMRHVLRKRQDKTRAFFDSVAGKLGKDYVPGKSWKSIAEALLRLMPPLTITDLGAGEGSFALLLAQRAAKVIAVDSSARMIEVGRELASRHGIANIDFRQGDMEELPISAGEVDLVFYSQSLHHALHPARALAEAFRILAPRGRVAILDLAKHRFEEARELYADQWLGFSESDLEDLLLKAGFVNIETSVVDKEPESPYFQTLLAVGEKSL
jgi:ArsR family transcriptional regulator